MKSEGKKVNKNAFIVAFIVLGAILGVVYSMPYLFPMKPTSHGIPVAYHEHFTVDYYVNGERELLPSGIGLKDRTWTGYLADEGIQDNAPIHTHDFTGQVHVEPTEDKRYTLADLFKVWGIEPSSACLYTLENFCSPLDAFDFELKDGDHFRVDN